MADSVYPKAREGFLGGTFDLDTDIVKMILVDTTGGEYAYSSAHNALDDVPASARVAVTGPLSAITLTDGVFDASNQTFTAVTGDQAEALIIYTSTGTESTSLLVCYIDSATGLPVTPNSGDITVNWNAAGIFAL
jgi:hypothetical protein